MTRTELENLLRKAGDLARDRDFFLVGSQALRAVCRTIPRDFPKTIEADLYPRRNPQAWAILRQRLGNASRFFKQHGYYLDCTDPGLATLPEGWLERLIPFRTPRTGGVTAWCLEPHDLFVTKLVAWREKNRLFLSGMLHHKFAKPKVVLERIEDLPVSPARKVELVEMAKWLISERRTAKNVKRKHR